MRSTTIGWLTMFAALAASPSALFGASLQIQPVTIRIEPTARGALLTLSNHDSKPIDIQVRAFAWTQSVTEDHLAGTDHLRVSPPIQRIPPNEQQVVRVVIADGTDRTAEQSFRLLIDELPSGAAAAGQVRMLTRYSIPVFVAGKSPAAPSVDLAVRREGSLYYLEGENVGAAGAKLSDLRFVSPTGSEVARVDGLIGYVLPRMQRTWPIRIEPVGGDPAEAVIDIDGHARTFMVQLD